ncbi:UvrD-helicase domain-containing protein [Schnuerera ultunensis]|nr:UvrD-helicase domain-containing protein [Schnuerera ultunensis]
MNNTKEQNLSITTIDRNLAVNAGAGTGKTKVLTERYIYILEHGDLEKGKEVESIVAITFTKKATQEMKERIREGIKKRFSLGERWIRYYRDMEKANISTIHGFCGNILRDNSLNAGVDPMFTILDQGEADILLEDTILEELIQSIEEDEKIYNLVKVFNRDDLDKVVFEIKAIYNKIRTVGYSFEEVRDMTLSYISSIQLNPAHIRYIKESFIYLMGKSRKNSKIDKLRTDDIWLSFYKDNYPEEELISILEYLYDNIGTNSKEADRIEGLKDTINNVFLIKEKEYLWLYQGLFKLLIEIDRKYSVKKDELGSLDYDDLQILVLKLLDDESIRKKYQNKFKYIMVDEFQDTNELQKKIFYKLCSKDEILDRNNLFVVGDPKQSIYGFRGADLQVFYHVMEDIEKISNQKTINLNKNFRTVDTILEFVNSLFDKLMGTRYVSLKNHHVSKNKIDVEILEKEDLIAPPNISKRDYNTYYESRLIASRIKELVEEGQFNYGDFALLFRASTMDYIYEEALMEYGIPYYNIGGKGFYHGQEIIDLMNGLKATSNRYDTISTIGFLRSPMVGLSDKTLYWLLRHRENCLFETLDVDVEYIGEDEKNKIKDVKKLLKGLMVKKGLYGVYPLLMELIKKTYYMESLMLYHGGRQLVSNVYKFIELALDFDRNTSGSLEDFIDHVERLKDTDESQAKIHSEDADVVKLMTIHKSKGLQFPVVVIPQMSRGFNYQQPYILLDKDKGVGFKYDKKSPFYNKIKEDIKANEDEENKRLLYVAMTRAEKRLLLGNQGKDRGFKNMVKDLMDVDHIEVIDEVKFKPLLQQPIKSLNNELFQIKPFDNNKTPLLHVVKGYNQKIFSRISPSQFIEFNQCRRRFFMNYYNRLSLDTVGLTTKGETFVLNPTTKGNIVHKFCQYYKMGIESEDLMKRVVTSFGIEYDEDIKKELTPYIRNYIKYHREDYDETYSEKEFYLKVEDVHLYGIIDRINISDGKAEILDFKTNRVYNKDQLVKIYQPQLQLYVNVFKRITNMEIERAAILFLETGELEEIDISRESLEKNYEDIKGFIQFINENNSIEQYKKSEECEEYCEYSILCNIN